MLILLKIAIFIVLIAIFYQDAKDRMVYWFLYPAFGILGFLIQLHFCNWNAVLIYISINFFLILTLLLLTYIYFSFFLKKQFINESIGLGDIIMFISLCFVFPTITFWILFTVSLVFSLVLYFILKSMNIQTKTVPLAGNMSIFYGFIYFTTFFIDEKILYTY